MPFYERFYSPGELQFITTSTYRRAPLFLSERSCRCFVRRLERLRQEKLLLIGWVLMEKSNYMHDNPVKRGLVSSAGDWPWSSWRFYFLQDASILAMDRLG